MKILDLILSRFEEIIVGMALGIGTILTFVEVVLRYVFGSSLGFTQELVVYLLIITGLVGASIGVREKVHLGVDIVVQQFPPKFQKALMASVVLLNVLFCIIITILGFQQLQILMEFGLVSPEMEIPMYIPITIVPISFTLMSIRFIQEFVKIMKKPAVELLTEKEGVH